MLDLLIAKPKRVVEFAAPFYFFENVSAQAYNLVSSALLDSALFVAFDLFVFLQNVKKKLHGRDNKFHKVELH